MNICEKRFSFAVSRSNAAAPDSETMTRAAPINDRGIEGPRIKLGAKTSNMETIRPKRTTGQPTTGLQQATPVEDLLRDMPEGSQEELQAMAEVCISKACRWYSVLWRGVQQSLPSKLSKIQSCNHMAIR